MWQLVDKGRKQETNWLVSNLLLLVTLSGCGPGHHGRGGGLRLGGTCFMANNGIHGSGGGASGRATAFCPSRPGMNPGKDFGFFSSELQSIGLGLFLMMCTRMVHTPSSTQYTIICNFIKCAPTMYQERGKNKNKKRLGKAHIYYWQWLSWWA